MAKLTVRGVSYHIEQWNEQAENTLVLLHGFTGSTATWRELAKQLPSTVRIVAIDLLGHGQTDAPKDAGRYIMDEQLKDLEAICTILQLPSIILLGYSMGGRVALSFAYKYPEKVKRLILESASPGLQTEQERLNRQNSDETLANNIEQRGLEAFVDFWENIPLFASQKTLPIAVQQAIRQERLSQKTLGLANSLRGLGTGMQPSLWEQLQLFTMPVLCITGSLDEKFCRIAKQMIETLPNARHELVNKAGHAIHVENPVQFATIVKEQLFLS